MVPTSLLLAIVIFTISVFCVGIGGVVVSGAYPVEARPARLQGRAGSFLVTLLTIMVMALAGASVWFGVGHLPWPAAIISGGLALLFSPMGFQVVPSSFWDSCPGVTAMAVVTAALTIALFCFRNL